MNLYLSLSLFIIEWIVFIHILFKGKINLQIYYLFCCFILYLPSWSNSCEKIPTFFVCLSQLRRSLKVCKPSMWTLAEFRADCNLIYLLFAWLSLEFLEFFDWIISWRVLRVGEVPVTHCLSPFLLCFRDRGQVIKIRVWELCSNF